MLNDTYFLNLAIKEAKKSFKTGGIPIGAILVNNTGEIISKGHNRLVQENSNILHAEMDAIENAGKISYRQCQKLTLYTTLSPCPMCAGAIILYNIPRVVIGNNISLKGAENILENNGVEVKVLNLPEAIELYTEYMEKSKNWIEELERVGNSTKSL